MRQKESRSCSGGQFGCQRKERNGRVRRLFGQAFVECQFCEARFCQSEDRLQPSPCLAHHQGRGAVGAQLVILCLVMSDLTSPNSTSTAACGVYLDRLMKEREVELKARHWYQSSTACMACMKRDNAGSMMLCDGEG